ncbi:MAG: YggU family protein [Chromatiaceae bacterium]|nr:YggU family protein [Chromatiaceae bacterium]
MTAPADTPSWHRWEGEDLLLSLRVQPRASADAIGEVAGDHLKIRLTAPPVEGKANAHLRRFLAKLFAVPPSRVTLVSGEQARLKRVRIQAPGRLPDFMPPHRRE